jgi:ATP-dependent Clp protease ATP-binding subunit ClpB
MEKVRSTFAPEFLNRLSAIVMFNSLGTSQLERIVQKAMKGVKRRLAPRGIKVVLERSGAKAILDASYDPSFGARPVERYLEGTVVTKLSRMLISGELASGTIVHIEAAPDTEQVEEEYDDANAPLSKRPRTLQYRVEPDPEAAKLAAELSRETSTQSAYSDHYMDEPEVEEVD